ncbi:MAG: hypothetical protein LBC29_04745, partial [Propionibacteriaceae bacterium]|nr:hypothetical protein [Propionibacteriaceae bacterium]
MLVFRAAARVRWASALLACGLLLAVVVLGARVNARVQAVLDENWRGSYDILVTVPGGGLDAVATAGLVDANFVATAGQGGISLEQLERIRAINGVEVAAPVGMVGSLGHLIAVPMLDVIDDPVVGVSDLSGDDWVASLKTTVVLQGSGGDDESVVMSGGGRVWLRKRPESAITESSQYEFYLGYSAGVLGLKPIPTDTFFEILLGKLPRFSSVIFAVDPVAETQLLGVENAAFLAPLVELATLTGVSGDAVPDARVVDETWAAYIPDMFSTQRDEFAQIIVDAEGYYSEPVPVVPMVVNNEPARKLILRLEIAVATADVSDLSVDSMTLAGLKAADFVPYTTLELDVSTALLPFYTPEYRLLLPESVGADRSSEIRAASAPEEDTGYVLTGRPDYENTTAPNGATAFEVVPRDVVFVDGYTEPETAIFSEIETEVKQVRSYRSAVKANDYVYSTVAPLGSFSTGELADFGVGDLSYVSMGYSSAVDTWRVSETGERVPVLPNLSNLDFITAAPGAFTDLEGGALLRGETPIDAVRVRVAGITSYSPQTQAKIADIAGQIELLGLEATVVAGSSPQSISLFVPDYYVDKTGAEADLGWVSQDWATLGAAVDVEQALSGTVLVLVGVALLSGAAGLSVSAVVNAKGVRSAVRVLREVGWRRARILRQVVRELAPASLLTVAVGVGCLLLGAER